MAISRRVAMILSCVGAVVAGIVAGPALQVQTYLLTDGWLPHPDGYGCGFNANLFRGIQGAFVLVLPGITGAVWAQSLTVPLVLSFFLPPRLGVRLCSIVALGIGMATGGALLANGLGLFPQGVMLTAKHGLLLYFGFPVLCLAVLTLRAAFLATAGSRGNRPPV